MNENPTVIAPQETRAERRQRQKNEWWRRNAKQSNARRDMEAVRANDRDRKRQLRTDPVTREAFLVRKREGNKRRAKFWAKKPVVPNPVVLLKRATRSAAIALVRGQREIEARVRRSLRLLKQTTRLAAKRKRMKAALQRVLWKALRDIGGDCGAGCSHRARRCNTCAVTSLTGLAPAALRAHVATTFTEGMAWANYGKWEADHIKPCARFDLYDPEQQRQCFHWSNLRALWQHDNRVKWANCA